MAAKNTLRLNKTAILDILSTGYSEYQFILHKVHECDLITQREYNNLNSISREDVGGHCTRLVDKLMNKGEGTCQHFLNLLQRDEDVTATFPLLKDVQWEGPFSGSLLSFPIQTSVDATLCDPSTAACVTSDDLPPESKKQKKDEQYLLASRPTGLCVIMNNEMFEDGSMRAGTNKDAESMAVVFSWLGFRVLMCKDQTKDQMDRALKFFASPQHLSQLREFNIQVWSSGGFSELEEVPQHGDAFICCILSHGEKGAVKGTDGKPLSIKEVMTTFNGSKCSKLISKPKVFFIQACQGKDKQLGVVPPDFHLEADGSPLHIPVKADFLVAMSTVEDYVSFRDTSDGSWFIQAVCQQLQEGCPRGDDIMDILRRVNSEVSQKEGSKRNPGAKKQMPEIKVTLRKRLVFSPHHT
ncbi:caspase-7-like [Genypterus blacodes]|uniref:caspase-7-like n=1 Tax=Genypterus blacodes TaxID=154954 RepID=UPI003F75DDE5